MQQLDFEVMPKIRRHQPIVVKELLPPALVHHFLVVGHEVVGGLQLGFKVVLARVVVDGAQVGGGDDYHEGDEEDEDVSVLECQQVDRIVDQVSTVLAEHEDRKRNKAHDRQLFVHLVHNLHVRSMLEPSLNALSEVLVRNREENNPNESLRDCQYVEVLARSDDGVPSRCERGRGGREEEQEEEGTRGGGHHAVIGAEERRTRRSNERERGGSR